MAAFGLAACNTPSGSALTTVQLKEAGTGVAVLSAVAGYDGCERTDVEFGQFDPAAGGWRVTRSGAFMAQNRRSSIPVGFTFQEGRYGILTLSCGNFSSLNLFRANDLNRGKFLATALYETPLATFDIKNGEVVVIGRIEARSIDRKTFYAVVSPLPAEALDAFRARNPGLAQPFVFRTMTPVKPKASERSR